MGLLSAFLSRRTFSLLATWPWFVLVSALTISLPSRQRSNLKSHLYLSLHDPISKALNDVTDLPITAVLDQLCDSLSAKPNLLLEAEVGAGKTTVVPIALLKQKWNWNQDSTTKILVVEPRRVAARSAAQRMAVLLNERVGGTVGYAMRGETRQSSSTCILVVTDGVLLAMLREDPELGAFDIIICDEFHERGCGSDTALALCREAQRQLRPELRIVVMSATLLGDVSGIEDETEIEENESTGAKLVKALGGLQECEVLRSDGRQYPIQVRWATQMKRYQPLGVLLRDRSVLVSTMCDAIEAAMECAPARGDILAFLPGVAEIRRVINELQQRNVQKTVEVLPLYGALPKDCQDLAIFPSTNSPRRIIVSTPIAEASLTLERITCVVDSGLRREPRCDVDTGMPRLITTRCSQASAVQRAGRAGRVQEGMCLRIYGESEYESFPKHSPPEIKSTDLAPTLLLLLDWGCSTISEILHDLSWVDPPGEAALEKALQLLIDLEAVVRVSTDRLLVTDHGRLIAKIPIHPRFATTIVKSPDEPSLVASIAVSFLLDDETGAPRGQTADLVQRIRLLLEDPRNERKMTSFAARISTEARNAVKDAFNGNIGVADVLSSLGPALLPGFIDLVAQRKGEASYSSSLYLLSLGRSARLDGLRDAPEFIVVTGTSTSDDGVARIRSYAPVNKDLLFEKAVEREKVFTVPSRGYEVRARRTLMVGSLELSSTPLPTPSSEEVVLALKSAIRDMGGVSSLLQLQSGSKRSELDELCERVRLAAKLSDASWPQCFEALDKQINGSASEADAEALGSLLEPWLVAAGSLKKLNLLEIFHGSLSPAQQTILKREFPTFLLAPDGSRIPLSYKDGVPIASAKLQQFFGTVDSPCIGPPDKQIPVTLSLLSPSGKQLAQTVDLLFFWRETYPSVRSEMRGRYPKHPWPENGETASPSRMTKKEQAASGTSTKQGIQEGNVGKRVKKKKKRGKRR